MDDSFISPVVDLFREILYDILGLFVPGAALLLVLHNSPFATIRDLVSPIAQYDTGFQVAAFIGVSYVLGYAVQGFAGRFWGILIVKGLNYFNNWKTGADREVINEHGMDGISPAFLQVKQGLHDSVLLDTLRVQIGKICGIDNPQKLSINEIQNLCYSLAGDRADDAFAFSFRADLSNGMCLVSVLAIIQTLFAVYNLSWKLWIASLIVYGVLALGFGLRAWTYFNIRGRIIYSIGLAAVSERSLEQDEKIRSE